MTDDKTNLLILKEKVKKFVEDRDWNQYHHPKELAISLSLEASELLELFQWKVEEREDIKNNKELLKKISEELADVIIYAIDIANETGIDISEAVIKKIGQNAAKYPVEKAKGKNLKYTEL